MKDLDPVVLFAVLQEMVGGGTAWLLLVATLVLAAATLFALMRSRRRRGGFGAQAAAPAAVGIAAWIVLVGLLPWATDSSWSNVTGVDWVVLPAIAFGPALALAAVLFDLKVLASKR